jgi:transglutaminase-like putative cysteine protease
MREQLLSFVPKCLLVSVALLCAAALPAASQSSSESWNIPRFSEDTAALFRAASALNPPAGAGVIVLDEEASYVFDEAGRATETFYYVYKIINQSGVDDWDNFSLDWEPWHDDRPVVRARVITPDGAVHLLDQKTIADAPASESDSSVYSDRRVFRAPFPAIAPGSVVELEETVKENSPLFDKGVVNRYIVGRSVPVQRTVVSIEAPSSLPIHYGLQLLPDMQPARTESDGRVRLVFEHGPMEPFDELDPDLPSDAPGFPEISFSTGTNWHDVAESYAAIIDRQIGSSNLQSAVTGITKGKSARVEKVAALLQYLDTQIRYTGVEFGDASITPRTPAETLKHRFGDCKDKSALLVTMLRAAGIPAYVALLSVSDRADVPADLPGLGRFDHAIVFAPGDPDLWIDATDQYARLGQLPYGDQGRLALVAKPETTALTPIPVSSSLQNLVVEKREFYLAENGPARVVDIFEPHGSVESGYRAEYVDLQNKDTKKGLTDYMKSEYLADSTDRMDRSDPDDISRQFTLTLESKLSKRGDTDLDIAVIAIRLESLFDHLPKELREREPEAPAGDSAAKEKPKKPRTADYQLPAAFAREWQYTIVPPMGFRPKPLPAAVKISLGPATLTEDFSAGADGIVHAVIRFDTVKRRFTVAEANDLRDKVATLIAGEATLIYFEPVGQALLAEGKVEASFQAYREMISAHAKEAVHHLQIAKALLAVGLGSAARQEAQLAVSLEPKSALAQKTLAELLQYDEVGRKLRPGSDYSGAAAAFRAAQALDPDDKTITGNLAILLEYNSIGLRYGPCAPLSQAIAEYRSLTHQQLAKMNLLANLSFALFYDLQFDEALQSTEDLNPQPNSLIVACEAALHGSSAALQEARKRSADEDAFRRIVTASGEMLAALRQYSLAADLMEAGASGDSATNFIAEAAAYRKTQPRERYQFGDDASGVALRFAMAQIDLHVTLEQLRSLTSRDAQPLLATAAAVEQIKKSEQADFSRKARSGTFADAGVDLALTRAQPHEKGNDSIGYKIAIWPSTDYKLAVYVVKEGGAYKVLGTSQDGYPLGLEVLDRLDAGNVAGARALLDWLREDQHLSGGDDPMTGAAFPRFWTKGRDADPSAMRLAAAAILVASKATAQRGISILEAARATAKGEIENQSILLALLDGYDNLDDYQKALDIATELARQVPESARVFYNEAFDLCALGRFDDAIELSEQRLQRIPDGLDAQRELEFIAAARGNYALAHRLALQIIQSDEAVSSDFNQAAWLSLFTGKTDDNDLAFALKAAQFSQNRASELHTLGCVYVQLGKIKEAHEVLIQAMDKLNLDEPESNYWFAFGSIAEASGLNSAAVADYSRATKPERAVEVPQSSYQLAQMHLKALGAAASSAPAK